MLPDQAAGLRRRTNPAPRCIHCVASSPAPAERLGEALHQQGWHVLRVETARFHATQFPARNLFDWRQQLAQGRISILKTTHGDVWHAPALEAGAPGVVGVAARYDAVLLDADLACDAWTPMPGADNRMIIDVPGEPGALQQVFRLLKTAAHCSPACEAVLIGDGLACTRLQEAAGRFLDIAFTRTLVRLDKEVEPFAVLAARMAGEEKGRSARC